MIRKFRRRITVHNRKALAKQRRHLWDKLYPNGFSNNF